MEFESIRSICDITRKECEPPLRDNGHSVTLSFSFRCGSKLDGAHGRFHLRAAAAGEIQSRLERNYAQLRPEQESP